MVGVNHVVAQFVNHVLAQLVNHVFALLVNHVVAQLVNHVVAQLVNHVDPYKLWRSGGDVRDSRTPIMASLRVFPA